MQFHRDQIVSSIVDIYQSNENHVYTCNTVPDNNMQVAYLHKKQYIRPTEIPNSHLFSNLVRKCSRCFLEKKFSFIWVSSNLAGTGWD